MAKKAQKIISAEERIRLVRDGWYIREPALFLTFMSHIFTANPSIRGVRSGQGRVEYNPEYLAALSAEEAEEVLKIEMIRILLRHPYRWPPRNAEISYIASNITLNEYYDFSSLPYQAADFWDDPEYRKRNFEFYYRKYLELARQQTGSMGDDQSDGNNTNNSGSDEGAGNKAGENSGNETNDTNSSDKTRNNADKDGAGNSGSDEGAGNKAGENSGSETGENGDSSDKTGNNADKDGAGNSGSADGAGNKAGENSGNETGENGDSSDKTGNNAGADGAGNSGSTDGAGNSSGNTRACNAENAALWTNDDFMDMKVRAVIEFTQQNMLSWGTIRGALVQNILATLKPTLDYRKVLSGFRATVLSSNMRLTRFRPSRRYGFVYMGKKSSFTTRLLIGIDVSGSISDQEINLFYSAINRFFKYGIEAIDVQQFDAELQGEPLLIKKARKTIKVKGRGGTCFQPIIDYFAANRKTYNGLIIFTDGFAPHPDIAPQDIYKVLWICSNKQNYDVNQDWMSKQGRCCWIQA